MLWLPSLADFLNRPAPAFLVLFELKLYCKTVGFSGIRTRIVGVEGEHADHLTNLDHHHGTISLILLFNSLSFAITVNKDLSCLPLE